MITRLIIRVLLPIVLLAVGLTTLVIVGQQPTPEKRDDTDQDTRLPVETKPVTTHVGGLDIRADGLVVPYREITLAAEVSGTVVFKSALANEGTYVTAGKELLRIDPRSYELEIRRLEGELTQAKTSLKELAVEIQNAEDLIPLAERELAIQNDQQERFLSLRPEGVISQEQLEDAERGSIAARNALLQAKQQRDSLVTRKASLEAAIEVGKVELEKAQLDLHRATIKAPVSGVIIRHDVEKNSYVAKGAPLLSIEDTEKVEVRCNLRMDEMRWIWAQPAAEKSPGEVDFLQASGEETDATELALATRASDDEDQDRTNNHSFPLTDVTVRYALGGRTYTWSGVLDRYDGLGLDEKTRMIPCRILVDKPNQVLVDGETISLKGPRSLVRGMYVNITIHAKPEAELLQVPPEAIQPGKIVWRVRDDKLERVELQIAQSRGEAVIVDARNCDLREGDQLVTSPLRTAFTGLEVRVETGP